jgi:hypothetical protein
MYEYKVWFNGLKYTKTKVFLMWNFTLLPKQSWENEYLIAKSPFFCKNR